MGLRFEWDAIKAAANLAKHHVAFTEAAEVFADPLEIVTRDDAHSQTEERWFSIGQTSFGQLVVVFYTQSGDTIRIISARKPTQSERRNYEEGSE